ncbi:MAG: phosphoribosylformylglycinamidine cyclo-ligase [Treponema sp.]|nr:phosphoribosylformylglycinamidine cyclo-ligase [Treponema sp.]MCL2251496.1 phosphoribosylformylglycinamidine cyclo-ligase [Treponema sp.]
MQNSFSESYKNAGVDVTAGYKSIELIKKHIDRTKTQGMLEGIGGFGGLFALPKNECCGKTSEPVLVSGTDGVGTKLKIAMLMDKHDTVGIDCVAMCVNDIICAGAKPLFFLDYIALGKNKPEKVEQIVAGVAEGCVQALCALVGGETAEHPGMMEEDEYDIAGFSVGIVEKSKILNKINVKKGDVIISLASSGVHSNGFSLTRKVFEIDSKKDILNKYFEELGKTLGEELLTPTKIYVKSILTLLEEVQIKSICHITGGGFYENIPRAFSENYGALIKKSTIETPSIFKIISDTGKIPQRDMFNTYNMGVGLCVFVSQENADKTLRFLKEKGENAAIIGEICESFSGVKIE